MRKNTSVAVALLLLFFLLPLIFLARDPLIGTDPQETPEATLPLEQAAAQTGEEDSTRTVRVQQKDGTVITLTMEEYLWRVVAAEMPASFELEALKAQAIAARTYTLSRMATVHANHPDADVCTDYACCQAYITQEAAAANWGENGTAYADKITAAVAETDGQVIVYEGQPIQAVFFSSSAGRTVDAVEVWGNAVPYLTSVVSPEGDEVPNYHTEVTLTADEFRKTFLAAYPAADLSGEPSGWFGAVTPTSAGGVSSMEVGGRQRKRYDAAHAVFFALDLVFRVRRRGKRHLFRDRLWTRRGHESVWGECLGRKGNEGGRDHHLVLLWGNGGKKLRRRRLRRDGEPALVGKCKKQVGDRNNLLTPNIQNNIQGQAAT